LRARDVWLEDADIDLFAGATCLLHQLKELGLDDDLRGLFGLRITPEGRPHPDADALRADANGRRFIRRSCRLEDLVQLGLLDAETGLTFSPRAGSLTDWLARAVGVLAGGEPGSELSPLHLKRCRKLLRADRDRPKRLDLLRSLSARLSHAHQYGRVAEWLIALNELLNQFGRGRARAAYRKHLRDRGFPVYPLVHLTLLSGLKAPLDWYAIPFSGTLRLASQSAKPKAGSPFRPHGASLVLATARSPSEARDLVTKLQPVLLPTLIPQLGQWTEEVVAKSAQVAAFSSIIAARKHYFKRMADWFELYTNPDDRETQIRSRLKDAKEVRRLGELMGEMLSAARLADKDYDEIGSLAASGYKWALDDVKLWDFYSAAKEIVMPLAQMRQRDIDDAQVRDCGLRVRVPSHAAFHLVLELLRNAVVHDLPGASTRKPGPILVRVAKRGPKIVMSIWNAISTVDDLPRRRFQENKKKYSLRNFADAFQARKMNGLTVVTFLGQLSGCGTSLDNREHPTARERVGVAEIVFPASG
jgi:hypothetical protein